MIRHLTVELRRQEVQTWKKVIRVISHELNNSLAPVASLANSAAALIEREQYQRLPEILRTIEDRAKHLERALFMVMHVSRNYRRHDWKPPTGKCLFRRCSHKSSFQLLGSLPEEVMSFDRAQMEQALPTC